jgi:uncharacterized protein YrzB (UPF0473 family)
MSDDFGPTFVTLTDEDGNDIVLEFVDILEYNGVQYHAYLTTETEGEEPSDDTELVVLKLIEENGEQLLSTPDTDEEYEKVYELFCERLFDDPDDDL